MSAKELVAQWRAEADSDPYDVKRAAARRHCAAELEADFVPAGEAVAFGFYCAGVFWRTEQGARDCWNPGDEPVIPLYITPPDPMLQRVVEALVNLRHASDLPKDSPEFKQYQDEADAALAEARKVLDKVVTP